jgi:hypothetical protein
MGVHHDRRKHSVRARRPSEKTHPAGRQPIDGTKSGDGRLPLPPAVLWIHKDGGLRQVLDTRNKRSGGEGRESEGASRRVRVGGRGLEEEEYGWMMYEVTRAIAMTGSTRW